MRSQNRTRRPSAPRSRRPRLEVLEDRLVPAAFLVTTTLDNGDNANPVPGSLRDAILHVNADVNTDGSSRLSYTGADPTRDEIDFALPWNDPGHVYYKDDQTAGQVTRADVTAVPAGTASDADLANAAVVGTGNTIDPDWSHSWWSIHVTPSPQPLPPYTIPGLPYLKNTVFLNGESQAGFSKNSLPAADNAVLTVELDGSLMAAHSANGLVLAENNGVVRGLVINGFRNAAPVPSNDDKVSVGINTLSPGSGNVIADNFIGTDVSGTVAVANDFGIGLQSGRVGERIGLDPAAPDVADRNLISGQRSGGVALFGGTTHGNTVAGNLIGTDRAGNPLGNGQFGVALAFGTNGNQVGAAGVGNTIADNGGPGVWVASLTAAQQGLGYPVNNSIRGNSLHDNGGLGIDLGGPVASFVPFVFSPDGVTANDAQGHVGPNDWQNFPVLAAASSSAASTTVAGTFDEAAEPNATLTLDFYANPTGGPSVYGQGQTYLGARTVVTDSQGHASFSAAFAVGNLAGQWLSATATDANGNTSEFALDVQAASAPNQTFTQSLPAALPQSTTGPNTLTIQADTTTVNDVVTAVNPGNLGASVVPVSVYLNLAPGNYTPTTVAVPAGMTLYINGVQGTVIDPASPAFTVTSGNVVVSHVTFVTTGNAPTVVVTGGHLTLRHDVLQESTGSAQAALVVTGGAVDLGTAADPGGNTLNVNGLGLAVVNLGPNPVSAVGNTFAVNGVALTSPYRIADRIFDARDPFGGGLVTYVPNNVYVTQLSGSIQRAVNAVPAGTTVNVEAGFYGPYAVGAKPLTIAFQNGPTLALQQDTPTASTLRVTGGAGFNHILFQPGHQAGTVAVAIDGLPTGTFAPTSRLVAHGGGANAHIEVSGQIKLLALLFADGANGHLEGGGGPTVEVGGGGSAHLEGGTGRNLLIGGPGGAHLEGHGGDDILIAGTTDYDTNEAALTALIQEWARTDETYAQRVSHILNGGGLNGAFALNATTVHANGESDHLEGGGGADLFFASLTGPKKDKLDGLLSGDVVVDLGP